MSKRIRKIAGILFVLSLSFVLMVSMSACGNDEQPAAEEPAKESITETQTPAAEPVEEAKDFTTVTFTGPEQAGLDEELVYTISAANTNGLATATFRMEMDAACMEEPVVEGLNGFMVLTVDFEEVDGKWVGETIMMNLEGITAEESVDVACIYAANKGVSGTASAALTGADLSAYVGEDSEDWVDVIFGATTVETEIS